MTLPDERIRAVRNTREFLYTLLDPKKTPKVPRSVRVQARHLLKHYPSDTYLVDILDDSTKPLSDK